jgi:hypothetical protein
MPSEIESKRSVIIQNVSDEGNIPGVRMQTPSALRTVHRPEVSHQTPLPQNDNAAGQTESRNADPMGHCDAATASRVVTDRRKRFCGIKHRIRAHVGQTPGGPQGRDAHRDQAKVAGGDGGECQRGTRAEVQPNCPRRSSSDRLVVRSTLTCAVATQFSRWASLPGIFDAWSR